MRRILISREAYPLNWIEYFKSSKGMSTIIRTRMAEFCSSWRILIRRRSTSRHFLRPSETSWRKLKGKWANPDSVYFILDIADKANIL